MDAADSGVARITVIWGEPGHVHEFPARVSVGSSVAEAIMASGILQHVPEVHLDRNAVGIHNRICTLEEPVSDGDRIEIYRPLQADPKEARRRRAEKERQGR